MDMFGLGILLNAKDQASASIYRVSNALEELSSQLEDTALMSQKQMGIITHSIQATKENLDIGLAFTSVGSEFLSMSNAMISPLVSLGNQVVSTSSQFEQWRMTLKALYGDAEVATQKLQWGMNLAAQTPFDVEDVTQALIGFKAVGAEADAQFANASGEMRSFLEYMGDLAALRPDVGLQGVLMGVRNLLGGDGGRSLKMRMDIDLENILGRDFGSTTEEIMQDLVTVSDKLANGLMTELEGTWEQMISNLEDQSTRFFLAIGDGGAFEQIKKSLKTVSDAVGEIDDDRMAKIGKNIASAMNLLTKPLELVSQLVTKVAMAVIKLIETSPLFSKLIVGFLGVVAGGTALAGVILLLNGGFFILKGALAILPGLITTLKVNIMTLMSTIVRLLPKVALWGSALALVYKAWKDDFGGIRTLLTNYMNNMYKAFSYSAEISQMGVDDMKKALSELDTTTFGGWLTYRLVQLRVLWIALADAWNDNTLSDENFQKARELGLLPIIETILDLKARFESFVEGFTQGSTIVINGVVKVASKIIEVASDIVTSIFPVKKGVDDVSDSVKGIDLDKWEKFGEITGYIVTIIGGILLVSKVVGVITAIGGAVMKVFGFVTKLISIISSIGKVIGLVVSGIGGLVTTILGFFGIVVSAPAWLVGAITIALVAIVALLLKHSELFRNIVSTTLAIITAVILGAVVAVIGIIMSIVTVVMTVVGIIATVVGTLVGIVTTIVLGISAIIYSGVMLIYGVISTIITAISVIITTLVGVVSTVIAFITGFFQTGFALIQAVIQTFLAVAKALFTGDFTTLAETLKNIWSNFANRLESIWNGVMNSIRNIWDTVKTVLSQAWDSLKEKWSGIMSNISEVGTGTVEAIKKVWSGIGTFFSGLWSGIMDTASTMFSWLADKFSWVTSAVSTVKGVFSRNTGGSSSVEDGTASRMSGNMVGLNTGGYVKTEGVAMLHPNEVVVNDELTQRLRAYLDTNEGGSNSSVVQLSPNIEVNVPELNNVISLAEYRDRKSTVQPMVSNADYSRSLTSNYENDYSKSLTTNYANDYSRNLTKTLANNYENDYSRNLNNTYANDYSKALEKHYTNSYSKIMNSNYENDYSKVLTKNANTNDYFNYSTNRNNNEDYSKSLVNNNAVTNTLNRSINNMGDSLDYSKLINMDNAYSYARNNSVVSDMSKSLVETLATNNDFTKSLTGDVSTKMISNISNSDVFDTSKNDYTNRLAQNSASNSTSILESINNKNTDLISNLDTTLNKTLSRDINVDVTRSTDNSKVIDFAKYLVQKTNSTNNNMANSVNTNAISNKSIVQGSDLLSSQANDNSYLNSVNSGDKIEQITKLSNDMYRHILNNKTSSINNYSNSLNNNVSKDLYNNLISATDLVHNLGDNTINNNTSDYNSVNEDYNTKTLYNKVGNVPTNTSPYTSNTETKTQKVDNSITINEGAIQITMTNGSEKEIDALVKKLFQKIQRENELRNTLRYKAN